MLKFIDVNFKNWEEYRKHIIDSEKVYHRNIRSREVDYVEIFKARIVIFKVALLDGRYIGTVVGYKPTKNEVKEYKLSEIFNDNDFIYIFNLVIDPEYQGKGYGSLLMKEFISSVKKKGYSRIVGHFRQSSSYKIAKKFGATEEFTEKNWENTGEDYILCSIDLGKI